MSEGIDERDRLTFWRGWYNQARKFPDAQRLAWYDAVLAYAFDGEEPKEPNGDLTLAIAAGAVESVRATIEISRKRREIGSKGGAKRKQSASKAEANTKQTRSKTKANRNQEQDQEQEQDQDQDHNGNRSLVKATTATKKQPPTIAQFQAMAVKAGVPADFAEYLHGELARCDWTTADGSHVANPIRYLKSAWTAEQKKIRAARASAESAGPLGLGGGVKIAR